MGHHGMYKQPGIDAMCSIDEHHVGRFGRIFSQLNPNYNHPLELAKLGAPGGPMDGGKGRDPSISIPMGMVFFGQFIDHDITLDTTSSLDQVNDPHTTQNFRTPNMDLDCIYGSGPEAGNFMYKKDGMYLLTGEISTAYSYSNQNLRDNDLTRTKEGVAVIGDPRNDENRIVSQLQLAFIKFHNKVVDHVISDRGLTAADLKFGDIRKEVYEEARRLVTWHYHWIVLYEYLPLIIGQPLVNSILGTGRKHFTSRRSFIPIEFSAAAYRFGHSLAPQKLKTRVGQAQDFDLFGGTLGFGFQPISDNRQIVEWKMMFDIDAANPAQRTDKLNIKLPADLLDLPFIQHGEKSLATRNLLRGQSFLLPSGELVAEEIGLSAADKNTINNHIANITSGIDISNGTPLWFYILAESEIIGRNDGQHTKPGEGLGQVGGTIVGETLIGMMENDPNSFLSLNRNWSPTLSSDGNFTMADLMTF